MKNLTKIVILIIKTLLSVLGFVTIVYAQIYVTVHIFNDDDTILMYLTIFWILLYFSYFIFLRYVIFNTKQY